MGVRVLILAGLLTLSYPFFVAKISFILKNTKKMCQDMYTAKILILSHIQVVMVNNLYYG